MNEYNGLPGILIPPSDKPQLPEDEMPYSVFVVDPVKLTEDEISKEDSGISKLSVHAQPSLSTPSNRANDFRITYTAHPAGKFPGA